MPGSSENMSFKGVPDDVVEHYFRLVGGYKSERNGVIYVEKHWSEDDEKTMLRLLQGGSKLWGEIKRFLPNGDDQIKLFDAAWLANINYDAYRFLTAGKGERRKNKGKKIVADIKKRANQLTSLLRNLDEIGYKSSRYPDNNLNNSNLQHELDWLIEKTDSFDLDKMSDERFVDEGISSQNAVFKREYLRGFIKILYESCLPIEKNEKNGSWVNIIKNVANAVLYLEDDVSYDDVSYDDVNNVMLSFKKKSTS
jgi:hypothetical protein